MVNSREFLLNFFAISPFPQGGLQSGGIHIRPGPRGGLICVGFISISLIFAKSHFQKKHLFPETRFHFQKHTSIFRNTLPFSETHFHFQKHTSAYLLNLAFYDLYTLARNQLLFLTNQLLLFNLLIRFIFLISFYLLPNQLLTP